MDLALLRLMRTRGHWPPLERFMQAFTRMGEHGMVWLAIAALGALVDPRRRDVYVRAGELTFGSYLVNIALKHVVRRPRPELPDLPPLTETISALSYPSAHATTSFAAARRLSAVLPAPLLYALATALALSRPYLGVHYPSEALAGAGLGTALAELLP